MRCYNIEVSAESTVATCLAHERFGCRSNGEAPVIDHLPVLHYGCLARDRIVPSAAVRKVLLHVQVGSALRKVRPTDGLIIMRGPNVRPLFRQIIESPQKLSVHMANLGLHCGACKFCLLVVKTHLVRSTRMFEKSLRDYRDGMPESINSGKCYETDLSSEAASEVD
jgi:hypothetical protein